MPPTEDFSTNSPFVNDQSSAVLHELRVLSERPLPTPALPAQYEPAQSESSTETEQHVMSQNSTPQLPPVSLHEDGAHTRSESRKNDDGLPNQLANLGLAAAAIWGAEAIGAVIFRSPKLAEMAIETAAGSTKVGLAAELGAAKVGIASADIAAASKLGLGADLAASTSKLGLAEQLTTASTKFGFLANDSARLYGQIGIFAGTYGTSIAARHYGHEALTGNKESWWESGNQVGTDVIALLAGRQVLKWSGKL